MTSLRTHIHAINAEWPDAGDDVSDELKAIRELVEISHALAEAITRLLPHAEDDVFQYGGDPDKNEDVMFAKEVIDRVKKELA